MKQYKKAKDKNKLFIVPLESRTSMLNKDLAKLKEGLKQEKPDKYVSRLRKYLKAGNKLATIKSILSTGIIRNFSVDELVELIYKSSAKVGSETMSSLLFFSALEKANGLWLEKYGPKDMNKPIARGNIISQLMQENAEGDYEKEYQAILAPNFAKTDELYAILKDTKLSSNYVVNHYDPTQKYMLLIAENKRTNANTSFTPTIVRGFTYGLDQIHLTILNDTMDFIEKEQASILDMLRPYISTSQLRTLLNKNNWQYYD